MACGKFTKYKYFSAVAIAMLYYPKPKGDTILCQSLRLLYLLPKRQEKMRNKCPRPTFSWRGFIRTKTNDLVANLEPNR